MLLNKMLGKKKNNNNVILHKDLAVCTANVGKCVVNETGIAGKGTELILSQKIFFSSSFLHTNNF